MVKKMKSPLEGLDPQQLQAGLRESAQQIWMAGLGAFAKAQAGGNKVFEALMKDGGALHTRTRKAARDQVDDMAAKASGTWDRLEQVFEKRVAQTLHTLGVPTHDDIETLSRRVGELSALVEALQKGGSASTPPSVVKSSPVNSSNSGGASKVSAKSAPNSGAAAKKAASTKATETKATAKTAIVKKATAKKAPAKPAVAKPAKKAVPSRPTAARRPTSAARSKAEA